MRHVTAVLPIIGLVFSPEINTLNTLKLVRKPAACGIRPDQNRDGCLNRKGHERGQE